jgi:solute carrier family 25 phosphate transporter 23/24/25/41
MREEGGVKALYRGVVTTSAGVAPYVAFNFASYELLKLQFSDGSTDPADQPGTLAKLACGAIAGGVSQTLTFPADLLRRRMQMVGLKDSSLGYHYTGAWDGTSHSFACPL